MKLTKAFAETPITFIQSYRERLTALLNVIDLIEVQIMAEVIRTAIDQGRQIFLMGNGGSASTCSHLANDLSPNHLVSGGHKAQVISLSDNIAPMSAIANDSGFEFIFSAQLYPKLRPLDVVLGMSVSGNSPNICNALEWANRNGGETIGWSGMNGGRVMQLAQISFHIPCLPDEYGPAEDLFLIVGHMIANYLILDRGGKLHH